MGRLTNLNPPTPIADADLPASIARDAKYMAADATHLSALDPHLQYPTQARGDARYVRKHGQYFKAAPSLSQEISVNIITKINFDTIIYNTSNQLANSKLTVLDTTELGRITTNILCDLPSTGRVILYLYKNGVFRKRLMDITCPAGYFRLNITPSDSSLQLGDYLEISALFLIGGGKVYGDVNLDACWWEGSRVG